MSILKSIESWPFWLSLKTRFGTLQPREKYSVLFVGLFIVLYLGWVFFIEPVQVQAKRAEQANAAIASEVQQVSGQIAMLQQALSHDFTKQLRADVANAKLRLTQVDQQLNNFSQSFTAATQVPQVLHDLLAVTKAVKVVSFKVNPAKAIDVAKLGEHDATTLFYEHQMILTLEGTYFDLHQYLSALQGRQKKLLVQSFKYQVQEYPNAQLTLQIATVSANEKFISL